MPSDAFDDVVWPALLQPSWNGPTSVPDALRHLSTPRSHDDAVTAYHEFLFAVGNDHAGTYWPVVVATVPFLGEILRSGGDWAREATLDALLDLAGSFWPEPGHELIRGETGEDVGLRVCLLEAISSLVPTLRELARDGAPATRSRQLAAELVELLVEPSDTTGAG